MIAKQSYLVCATPRTGSTLLCEMLRHTGRLGVPREYFEYLKDTGLPHQPIQYFASREGPGATLKDMPEQLRSPPLRKNLRRVAEYERSGYGRYLHRIFRQGTTLNGVFGAKIMWGHLHDFLDLLTGDGDVTASRRVNACLRSVFPDLKCIYVTRESKLRQAVSLWKAIQTQQWRLDAHTQVFKAARVPDFHFEAISFLRSKLVEQDVAWRRFFTESEIAPLVLSYEQFANNLPETLTVVAEFLGVKGVENNSPVESSLLRQADNQSEDFVAKYVSAGLAEPQATDQPAKCLNLLWPRLPTPALTDAGTTPQSVWMRHGDSTLSLV
jgi:LPS sulfotransferase NodH